MVARHRREQIEGDLEAEPREAKEMQDSLPAVVGPVVAQGDLAPRVPLKGLGMGAGELLHQDFQPHLRGH